MKKEFKIKYHHYRAQKILQDIGAKFKNKETLEDLYLFNSRNNIYKLSKVGGNINLVHLINKNGWFEIALSLAVDKDSKPVLTKLFKGRSIAMTKVRKRYLWKKSEVVLDIIKNLGEFMEVYPASENEKQLLFKKFKISSKKLIKESYYSLLKKKS